MRHTEERGGLVVHRAAFQQQDGAELPLEAAPLVARADVAADVRLRLLLRARGEGWEGARRRLAPLAVEDREGLGLARLHGQTRQACQRGQPQSLQIRSEEPVVASRGSAKTATLTMPARQQRLRALAEAHEEVVPSPELQLETTQGASLGRRGAAEERRGASLCGAVDHHEDLLQHAL